MEVEAIRRFIPDSGLGVEIGAGTGRFSIPFGIKTGIEPSEGMARLAQSRGLFIIRALAEELPFADKSIDYILMVTIICFLADLPTALREACRILKPGGRLIIGFIDRESRLGRKYESMVFMRFSYVRPSLLIRKIWSNAILSLKVMAKAGLWSCRGADSLHE